MHTKKQLELNDNTSHLKTFQNDFQGYDGTIGQQLKHVCMNNKIENFFY